MKLLNYDHRELIMQNVRTTTKEVPKEFTISQYRILRKLIIQKRISKQFFEFLLVQLFDLSDWKQLDYLQMYELIHILTYWNYGKRGRE